MDFHIELLQLKQELLKEIKKLEKKFTDLHKKESENINEDILTPLDKINIMLKKTGEMFQAITEQQFKIDKIPELEAFKSRMNDTIISHDIRLKSLSKDVEDITFKYDREISQNLTVPGFIGPSCRFKSMSEYLLFTIDDLTKIKMEKELMKKEEKELKSRLDSMVKSVLNLVDNSVKRSNSYTDNKQKNLEENLDNKYKEFNDKIMEMKTLTLSNEKFVKEQLFKVTNLANDLNFIKDNVEQILDKRLREIKSNINEIKNKTDKINNDVKKNNKNLDSINNILKNSGIIINNSDKTKFNSNKRISMVKKDDNNYKLRNNSWKKGNQEEKYIINENINSKIEKNSSLFKEKPNNELNNYMNQKIVEKNNLNDYFQKFQNKKETTIGKSNELQQNQIKKEIIIDKSNVNNQKYENKKESNIIKRNENFGISENKKEITINNSNEKFQKSEHKKEATDQTKNKINQNNIKAYNELKSKLKFKNINKSENKNNINSKDKIDSYSIEVKIPTERKTMNLDTKSNKEMNTEKIQQINDKINLSDGESEKITLKLIKKKRNIINNKINKYKIIKTDKNKSNENIKNKNDNKNQTLEKNTINYTDYNFYHHKKDLNAFHVYKNEIHNVKRYPFHKIFNYENFEENSQKANSDMNVDINLENNSSPKLQISKKINNIYYPNEEQIKNLKHKEFLAKQFLIRHNTNPNQKSSKNNHKIYLNDENNKMYETANNFFNNFNEFKNRSNILDKKVTFPPPLLKDNEYSLNKKDAETQSIVNLNKKTEKLNLKFISIDGQFKLNLHKKNLQFRNNPELLLSAPMTKVFKTFQMKKSKDIMINNNINNKNY